MGLFRGVVVKTIGCMILQLLGLNVLAVHAALIALVLWKIGEGSGSSALPMSARPEMLLPSL